jgi:hypothetical protein
LLECIEDVGFDVVVYANVCFIVQKMVDVFLAFMHQKTVPTTLGITNNRADPDGSDRKTSNKDSKTIARKITYSLSTLHSLF